MAERNRGLIGKELNRAQILAATLKETERAFQNALGANLDLRAPGKVNFVPRQRVRELDASTFTQDYLLASRLEEKGLPLRLAFGLQDAGTYRITPEGTQFFLSSDLFDFFAASSQSKPVAPEEISNQAIGLFGVISNLVLETLPVEAPVESEYIKRFLVRQTNDYLKTRVEKLENSGNRDQSEALRQIADQVQDELENGDNLTITACGIRLKLKVDGKCVMPYMGIYQRPVKNILTNYSRRVFISHLSKDTKKYPWFKAPDPDRRPKIDEVVEKIEGILRELDILDRPRQIFNCYVNSMIGQEIASGIQDTTQDEEEEEFKASFAQLKSQGIGGQSDEDSPLVTYALTGEPVLVEEQDLIFPEDDDLEDSPIFTRRKKGRERLIDDI